MLIGRERAALYFGWGASLVLHVVLAGYVAWRTSAPDLGFELQLPAAIEFGLSEAVEVSAGAPPAPTSPPPASGAQAPGSGQEQGLDGGVGDGGGDAAIADSGARRRRDAGAAVGQGEGEQGEGEGEHGTGRGVAFLPAGAQIALRLDVARVRASPLADDVRQLMAVLPDWRALLEGSGVEPLEDFDRLLIASPNLQRSRLIVAGRVQGDADLMRAAAARMAEARGQPIEWRQERGVPVTDWLSPDPTPRVLALVGPRHFVLCRAEDLSRVLAVARLRVRGRAHPADALLSMGPGEGLSLEVEGARNFARASRRNRSPLEMVPTGLRLALRERDDGRIEARTLWSFDDDAQARSAGTYWDRMRSAYAQNVLVAMLGVAPILERATITTDGPAMHGDTELSVEEMQHLLGLTRSLFADADEEEPEPPSETPPSPYE